jgi:hypothetical protein
MTTTSLPILNSIELKPLIFVPQYQLHQPINSISPPQLYEITFLSHNYWTLLPVGRLVDTNTQQVEIVVGNASPGIMQNGLIEVADC